MSKKTKTTSGPSKWAQPKLDAAGNELTSIYNANKGNIAELAGGASDLASVLQGRAMQPGAAATAGQGYITDVLGGKYMTGNPYLEKALATTRANVMEDVGSSFAGAGRYGSGQFDRIATEKLADAENQARMANYEAEMDRMSGAAGMVPSIEQAQYSGVTPYLTAAGAAAELPFAGVNPYAENIQNIYGGSTTTTQKQGIGKTLAGLAGTALSAYMSGGTSLLGGAAAGGGIANMMK